MNNLNKYFVVDLINWFDKNKRDLPFRNTKDPYKILVSEVMAQQTQIKSLIPYYNRFIEVFPDVFKLAESKEATVLKYWEGLGYYNRAKNLHKAAKLIVQNGFPETYEEFIKLPGVGPYIAGAVLSIAFNQKIAAVDGNILRVFSRLEEIEEDITKAKTKKLVKSLIEPILPENTGVFNQALMELGALICLKKDPKCNNCPVNSYCESFKNNTVSLYPKKGIQKVKPVIRQSALILFKNEQPLFIKRINKRPLNNLYGFPLFNQKSPKFKQFLNRNLIKNVKFTGKSKHVFTHLVWETNVFKGEVNQVPEGMTQNPNMVPTAFRKMLNLIDK